MKIFVTRIKKGEIRVDGELKASTPKGLAAFIGFENSDTDSNLLLAAQKIAQLRIFEDETGRMAYSAQDKNYPVLCIPNFTLCASTQKGRRPSFDKAMPPERAEKMFDKLILLLQNSLEKVAQGCFKAHMEINLVLDGPVNINLDLKP